MKTVVIVGCGSLGSIIARGISEKLSRSYQLIGLCDAHTERAKALAKEVGCSAYGRIEDVLNLQPDYLVEAAGGNVLKSFALDALKAGSDLITLSVGAFSDEAFYKSVTDTASALGRTVHIPSGAIGGFDVIRSAMWQGSLDVSIINTKAPHALAGAPYLENHPLRTDATETIFRGNAREAIEAFPKNVNVAVALAIASLGVDKTNVEVISMPGMELNTHTIELSGDFGRAHLEIASVPSDNAGSSSLAAYSVLAKLENLSRSIRF